MFKSLSFRLSLYSFFLTYTLLIGCWGLLYYSIDLELFSRDQETIIDRLKTIQSLLQVEPKRPQRLIGRIEKEWPNRPFERLYVRVFDDSEKILTETPGLNSQDVDLFKEFPKTPIVFGEKNNLKTVKFESRVFQLGVFIIPIKDSNISKAYIVQIALERTSEERLLFALRNSLIYIAVFGFIGSLLSGRITVLSTLHAIRQISTTAQKVSSFGLKERVDPFSLPKEFKEIAESLNAMLMRLEESFHRLSRFSEDMAHELRTPMNNLLVSLEVGISKERTISEYQSLIESSIEECGRLKRIIDSLLFIARANQPSQEIKKDFMNLFDELQTIITFYEISAEKKKIYINLEMPNKNIEFKAERVLFQRAIGNLISNSIRHSFNNSVIIISATRDKDYIFVSVTDNGEGIDKDLQSRVGERFFRADNSRSQTLGGHGLGLSIVKSIVEIHGGQLLVKSAKGEGSTFTLKFPV